jgi:Carboxypeptidase regulatory-like domain/TonB-dependent Receptor Plug Domain/TonB dependent receptor
MRTNQFQFKEWSPMRRAATTVVFMGKWSVTHALLLLFCLALLVCGGASSLRAQTTSATINGQITDPQGKIVPGVAVQAVNIDTSSVYPGKTNGSGIYAIAGIPPGRYRLVVRKDGFKEVNKTDLVLQVQDTLEQNFTLQVGSMSESVTVSGQSINMNTTDAAVSTVIDREFVENIPLNGRSFQDLLTLAPGVTYVGSSQGVGASGEVTVNGQRTEANYFTVDGVSANVGTLPGGFGVGAGYGGGTPAATALGTTQSMVSVDALQEFRATTSTYSAEYGRTPGGQFSFTTRSGTNDWHGSAFDYFRNEALDANNWFSDAEGVPKEKERQNDFGGTLGGPIRIPHFHNGRDKTFFFFSYEGLRLWTPQGLSTSSVPDQALRQGAPEALQPFLNAFPLPNKGEDGLNDGLGIYQVGSSFPSSIDSISVRIDHDFSDRFKIFGRYASTPSVSSSIYQATQTNSIINNRLVTLGATNLITSSQANELRFNITQVNSKNTEVSTNVGGAIPLDVTTLPGPNGSNLPVVGSAVFLILEFGGDPSLYLGQTSDAQRQYNFTDTYSWTLARHSLKFGIDWRRLTTYATPSLAAEDAGFPSQAAVLANNVGSSGFASAFSDSPTPVEPLYRSFSAFAQDEWKVTQRFSLSLGLRWDVNPAPGNLTGPLPYTVNQITNLDAAQLAPAGTPLWRTDWHGFAPRFGGAYQLRQSPGRETVLRAGFGVFYDMGNAQGSQGFNGVGFASSAQFTNVSFPLTSAQLTLPAPSVAPPYSGHVYAFDPNLKLPYTLQWNVALEQAVGNKQALTMSYVGSTGRRLLENYGIFSIPANPNFDLGNGLYITKNGPTSDYNALQVQFQRTLSHGLQALASYTYSHSIDDASSNFNLSDLLERASSDFDVRHNFQMAVTYDLPGEYSNHLLSALFKYWAFDSRVTARSALPVDVVGGFNTDPGTGANVYFHPNLVPGESLYLYGSQYPGGKIINYDAFNVPTSGPGFDSEGDTPRNYARGLGSWQVNFAVRRDFPIHERLHLQFRAEAFNLFNHPSFSALNNYWSQGPWNSQGLYGFGGAEGSLNNSLGGLNALYQTGGPRSLQLALKLVF